jgi:hypothetical protein
MTKTQWIPLPEEHGHVLLKPKISSPEEPDTNNALGAVRKEDTPEDPVRRMDKGKSSHASFVGSPVTLHETADRNTITIRAPHETTKDQQVLLKTIKAPLVFDKPDKKKVPSG